MTKQPNHEEMIEKTKELQLITIQLRGILKDTKHQDRLLRGKIKELLNEY